MQVLGGKLVVRQVSVFLDRSLLREAWLIPSVYLRARESTSLRRTRRSVSSHTDGRWLLRRVTDSLFCPALSSCTLSKSREVTSSLTRSTWFVIFDLVHLP